MYETLTEIGYLPYQPAQECFHCQYGDDFMFFFVAIVSVTQRISVTSFMHDMRSFERSLAKSLCKASENLVIFTSLVLADQKETACI